MINKATDHKNIISWPNLFSLFNLLSHEDFSVNKGNLMTICRNAGSFYDGNVVLWHELPLGRVEIENIMPSINPLHANN